MQLLAERITQSVNELALLIDSLYKLQERDRQLFINKIQNIKNNLLHLKSTLKVNNTKLVEIEFKKIRVDIIQMKRTIQDKLENVSMESTHYNKENYSKNLNKDGLRNNSKDNKDEGHTRGQQKRLNSSNRSIKQNPRKASLFVSSNKRYQCLFDSSTLSVNKGKGSTMMNRRQYEQMMASIVQREDMKQELMRELEELRVESQQHREERQKLKRKVVELEGRVLEQGEKSRLLELRVGESSRELVKSKQRVQELQQQGASHRQQLRSYEQQLKHYSSIANEYSTKVTTLSLQLSQLSTVNQQLSTIQQLSSQKILLSNDSIQKYERQIVALNNTISKLQLQLTSSKRRVQQLDEELRVKENKVKEIEIRVERQREDVEMLERQLNKARQVQYNIKLQKQTIQSKLLGEIQQLNSQLNEFNILHQQQHSELLSLTDNSNHLNHQLTTVKNNLQLAQQHLFQSQSILARQQSTRSQLQQFITQNNRQYQIQLNSLLTTIKDKQIQITELKSSIYSIQQLNRSYLELNKQLNQDIQLLNVNKNKLDQQHTKSHYHMHQLQTNNLQLIKTIQSADQTQKELISQIKKYQQQLAQMTKINLSLQTELKTTKLRLQKAKIQAIQDIRNTLF